MIKEVQFVKSSANAKQCPDSELPEYAFVGRSNVGKSSLINALTNKRKLAKTSSTPGKTQLINHFIIDEQWYLVDLPGYGFAKVSKKKRSGFDYLIKDYLLNRSNMVCLFLLIDSRHDPLKADMEFLQWLGEHGVPFAICFTKADKLTKNKLESSIRNYKKELLKTWEELPPIFVTSSMKRDGLEELLTYISQVNQSL